MPASFLASPFGPSLPTPTHQRWGRPRPQQQHSALSLHTNITRTMTRRILSSRWCQQRKARGVLLAWGRKKCCLLLARVRPRLLPPSLLFPSVPRTQHSHQTHNPNHTQTYEQGRCKATQRTPTRHLPCLPKPPSFLLAPCNAALPSTTGGMQESTPKRRPKPKKNHQKKAKKGTNVHVSYTSTCTTTPTGSLLSV